MPSYRRLARPSAPSLGSAAARMNDSLIDAQQSSLGEARRQWEAFAITPNGGAAQPNFRKVAAKHGGDVSMFGPRHISNGTTTIHLHNADFYIAAISAFASRISSSSSCRSARASPSISTIRTSTTSAF
ncbi:lipoprotein [Burkholderia mallei]|nr:lipoprotein [Burkholderia mallei]